MFVEKYIKEPFKYAMSDWKKIFVGGVFGLMYMLPSQVFDAMLRANNHVQNMESSASFDYSILLGLLGVFALIIFLSIIFGSLQYGYYMKLAKNTVESYDTQLPEWEGWYDLFKKGIMFYIGSLLLALIVFLPFIIIASIIGYGIYLIGIPLLLIIYFFAVLGAYLLIALLYMFYFYLASVNFANVGFKGFFEFKKIISLLSLKYVLLVIVLIIIMMALSFIASLPGLFMGVGAALSDNNVILLIISAVINSVLLSFIGFFTSVALYRSISTYYKEKMQEKGYL
ncbi:DUF4013 domain-containing protein [Methanothermococcus sp. Ax23]|uniref:DUF4013 domain-containing protein n=1 Tax=Methanothermococcus sp. Ax23 TaxID=3156486 RepID=UPI003BA2EBC4